MPTHRTSPETGARRRLIGILAVLTLAAVGCGDDTDTAVGSTTTTTLAPTSTTASPTSTTEAVPTSLPDDLPGEPFDLAPAAGVVLAVVGVAFDDALNVRSAPGVDQDVVEELDPTEAAVVASGQARLVNESIWWEITTPGGTLGWVNARFTAAIGPTGDITARVISLLGATPTATTMEDLGNQVAEALRPDPEFSSTITLTVAATVGDLGEVTYDLIGLADDSTHGLRLHVFGTPDNGSGFTLKSVEATDLCDSVRGVSQPSGLCT